MLWVYFSRLFFVPGNFFHKVFTEVVHKPSYQGKTKRNLALIKTAQFSELELLYLLQYSAFSSVSNAYGRIHHNGNIIALFSKKVNEKGSRTQCMLILIYFSLTCYYIGNTYKFSRLLLLGISSHLTTPSAVLLYF